ncbi:hypothetical protein [Heyndrickxia acidicola]|uniref:Uncharacterized protein n=1 Tax=Heyndrickxia acidicola TaxID=209389 RepID=A0ABU6MMC1_9BACI|nr:hypothetical protein [Heyndrickxia acidicola]MED1204210.1 hypothetical protein [Heyndrickxia acidicola]
MSLSSLLNGSNPNQKVFQGILKEIIPNKKPFKTNSGKEAFSKTQYETLVPYTLLNNYHSSVLGTAFDYLARVMLARVVKKNREQSYTRLVAELGFMKLSEQFLQNHPLIESKIEKKLKTAIKNLKAFTNYKKDVNELALDVCFLAKLEHVLRSGLPPADLFEDSFFDEPADEILQELISLCDVFQKKFVSTIVSPTSEIIYNPDFRPASAFVGGADGDVMIDGTLYDFKTAKSIGYKWQEVAQMVGYFLLNEISLDVNNADDNYFEDDSYQHLDIKRIAFYRARYGEIEYIDISYFEKKLIEITKKKLATYFVKNPNLHRAMIENLHILEALSNA